MSELEEGSKLTIDFGKIAKAAQASDGLIPVAVQNAETKEVILVAYTNELAFKKSIATRTAIFWSTSRNELWEKGKTSGNTFDLVDAFVNCEQNCLLYVVRPKVGGICHTANSAGTPRDCFYRRIDFDSLELQNTNP